MAEHVPALHFSNLSYTLDAHTILDNVSGIDKSGQIMTIMGASGAGKSTLLDLLAKTNERNSVCGTIHVNGCQITDDQFKAGMGCFDQEDTFMSTLTVYETVLYSALLGLPRDMSIEAKKFRTLETLNELGILNIKGSRIDDSAYDTSPSDDTTNLGDEERGLNQSYRAIVDPIAHIHVHSIKCKTSQLLEAVALSLSATKMNDAPVSPKLAELLDSELADNLLENLGRSSQTESDTFLDLQPLPLSALHNKDASIYFQSYINLLVLMHWHPSRPLPILKVLLCLHRRSELNGHMLAVSFSDAVEQGIREDVLVQYIDAAFHHLVETFDKHGSTCVRKQSGFQEASFNAIRTLAFISPETVLPRIYEHLRTDLDPASVNSLTDTDFDIWSTPEGATFVDVLSNKTEARTGKGKGSEIAKWEEEVKKSLANKKASGAVTLTKQQQALVQAQLEKEAAIRQRSCFSGRGTVSLLYFLNRFTLSRWGLGRGSRLVGEAAFKTYMSLATCCADRVDTFRKWIGVATLRALNVSVVPDELQVEPLNGLTTRVLYRLRSLSEQITFDGPTFSYAYPLLSEALRRGGISAADEDEALEQVTLALNIIKFHCSQFSDITYPRIQVIEDLLYTIRSQSGLTKDASSALIELGEAISSTASREDIAVLLHGLLTQEPHVRNACLQTLQEKLVEWFSGTDERAIVPGGEEDEDGSGPVLATGWSDAMQSLSQLLTDDWGSPCLSPSSPDEDDDDGKL
ncbi:hypothetical protein JOM56_003011 [Amanita muscaria]